MPVERRHVPEEQQDGSGSKVVYLPQPRTLVQHALDMGLVAAAIIGLVGAVWVQGQSIAVLKQQYSDIERRVQRLEEFQRPLPYRHGREEP